MAALVVAGVSAGVSALVSVITSVLDRAANAEKARQTRRLQQARDAGAALTSQIPPFNYPDKESRAAAAAAAVFPLKGFPAAYTNEGIIQALNADIIPAGYSLAQLDNQGFSPEVTSFRAREEEEYKTTAASFAKLLGTLADVLEDATSGDDSELRSVARTAGASQTLVNKFNAFARDVRADTVSEAVFNAQVRLLRGMLSLIGIEQDRRVAIAGLQVGVEAAEQKQLDAIQKIAARFIERGN